MAQNLTITVLKNYKDSGLIAPSVDIRFNMNIGNVSCNISVNQF